MTLIEKTQNDVSCQGCLHCNRFGGSGHIGNITFAVLILVRSGKTRGHVNVHILAVKFRSSIFGVSLCHWRSQLCQILYTVVKRKGAKPWAINLVTQTP